MNRSPLPPGPLWRGLAALLSLGLGLNGLFMLLGARRWYAATPGVAETGPFNPHFVQDIGGAFLAAALSLGLAAWQRDRRLAWPAAAFLLLHAGIHLVDALSLGHAEGAALGTELVGIHLPALLALALALPGRWQALLPIPSRLIEDRIAGAEKMLGVPLDYMREMAKLKSPVLFKLGKLMAIARQPRHDLPGEIMHFAMLGATQHEDCGECLQIGINLARAARIDPVLLQAVLDRRPERLPSHLALAWRFGKAVAENDPAMEDMRLLLERRIGRKAMLELSYDLAMARFYPTVKRALGYAKSCSLIQLKVA